MSYLRRAREVMDNSEESSPLTKESSPLTEVERAMVWEITKATGYIKRFEKLREAHSILLSIIITVNLVAFLQPPKGWRGDENTMPTALGEVSIMYNTGSIEAFAISNSLSLYSAISGLLFYLFCSDTSVLSMAAMEMPAPETYGRNRGQMLGRVRSYLRCKALPIIRRNANFLSLFLACSLTFSVMGFIASGYAATSPDERLHYVVFPGIPGCISLFIFLVLALRKHRREMDFDTQFDHYWKYVAAIDPAPAMDGHFGEECRKIHPNPSHHHQDVNVNGMEGSSYELEVVSTPSSSSSPLPHMRRSYELEVVSTPSPSSSSSSSSSSPHMNDGRLDVAVMQTMVWETKTALGFIASVEKLISVNSFILSLLATVNLIAFLQPPKGWNESEAGDDGFASHHLNAKSVMYNTGSIEAYAIASSLSLYSAISGLLFYLHCSHAGTLAMADESWDKGVLHKQRACLRVEVLPAICGRAAKLCGFVAASLTFSVIAFVASGLAASSPDERLHYVVLPALPGCSLVFLLLVLALRKHYHNMSETNSQFESLWKDIAFVSPPDFVNVDPDFLKGLDS